MKIVEQLSLFLENKPGSLAALCDVLASARINIYALSVVDSVDHAVVRMVVSDPRKALHLFETHGALVIETDVVMIEGDNKPGSLSRISKILSGKHINIEYAYLASTPASRRGLLIMRVNDAKRAVRALKAAENLAPPRCDC
jgi:hypothetical protein